MHIQLFYLFMAKIQLFVFNLISEIAASFYRPFKHRFGSFKSKKIHPVYWGRFLAFGVWFFAYMFTTCKLVSKTFSALYTRTM